MAKQTLPVNFKDDILNSSMGGKRRYNLIQNSDGTVSLEDVTSYTQVGSDFGAAQMNQTNKAVNESCDKANVIDDLDDIMANQASGMIAGAKAVADLIGNVEVGDSESMNGHYVLFKDQNLLINYGTCVVKNVILNQNGQWYTGSSSNIQYGEFAKAFSHLYSLTCSMSFGDWVSIIYQRADNTGIKELAFGYGAPYSSREFRIDYVAIGKIV